MRMYQTADGIIINLDHVSVISQCDKNGIAKITMDNGKVVKIKFTAKDYENIMEYNNFILYGE